jgi:hypothetical protein
MISYSDSHGIGNNINNSNMGFRSGVNNNINNINNNTLKINTNNNNNNNNNNINSTINNNPNETRLTPSHNKGERENEIFYVVAEQKTIKCKFFCFLEYLP